MQQNHENNTVSIVMVSYQTGPSLFECLAAAFAQEGVRELILVDNGNPPAVLDRLNSLAHENPMLRIITGHGNVGFAAGCNRGATVAVGDVLLLLNPDCLLADGFIKKMLAETALLEGSWLLGPRLLSADGVEQKGGRRDILTPWLCLAYVLNLEKMMPRHPYFIRLNLHRQDLPRKTSEIPAISGACMAMLRKDWNMLGGMDECYFLHVEDMDFCLRFHRRGGKVWFAPMLTARHFGATSNAPTVWVEWHKTKGFIRYFFKNFKGYYPPGFLSLVSLAVLGRFLLLCPFLWLKAWQKNKRNG